MQPMNDSRDVTDLTMLVCDLHDIGVFSRNERIALIEEIEASGIPSAAYVVAVSSFAVNHRYRTIPEGHRVAYIRGAVGIQHARLREQLLRGEVLAQ